MTHYLIKRKPNGSLNLEVANRIIIRVTLKVFKLTFYVVVIN